MIHGIDFEVGKADTNRKRRDDIFRADRSDTMHLESMKSSGLIVSVFFDMNGQIIASREEKLRHAILLHTIRAAFETMYGSHFEELAKCKTPVSLFVPALASVHSLSLLFP